MSQISNASLTFPTTSTIKTTPGQQFQELLLAPPSPTTVSEIKTLLTAHANLQYGKLPCGEIPLNFLIKEGKLEMAHTLAYMGISPLVQDSDGLNACDVAFLFDQRDFIPDLLTPSIPNLASHLEEIKEKIGSKEAQARIREITASSQQLLKDVAMAKGGFKLCETYETILEAPHDQWDNLTPDFLLSEEVDLNERNSIGFTRLQEAVVTGPIYKAERLIIGYGFLNQKKMQDLDQNLLTLKNDHESKLNALTLEHEEILNEVAALILHISDTSEKKLLRQQLTDQARTFVLAKQQLENELQETLAAHNENYEALVKPILAERSFNALQTTYDHYNLLHLAIAAGRTEMFKLLIENGFKERLNEQNDKGETVLHLLLGNPRIGNQAYLIHWLIKEGADPFLKDNQGFSAIDLIAAKAKDIDPLHVSKGEWTALAFAGLFWTLYATQQQGWLSGNWLNDYIQPARGFFGPNSDAFQISSDSLIERTLSAVLFGYLMMPKGMPWFRDIQEPLFKGLSSWAISAHATKTCKAALRHFQYRPLQTSKRLLATGLKVTHSFSRLALAVNSYMTVPEYSPLTHMIVRGVVWLRNLSPI